MSYHNCYVQTISTGGFFASCPSCGCDPFPNRESKAEAQEDARQHSERFAHDPMVKPSPERFAATTGDPVATKN